MRTSDDAFAREAAAVTAYLARCRDPQRQIEHCLGSGAVSELERRLAGFVGKKYCVLTSSASAALTALPHALGLARAEFVTTPATYGATVAGWLFAGGRPRFADLDPQALTLDPDSVRKRITPRTKALLAVDLFGTPCDDDALRAVANEYGLAYIADASQAFGAMRRGRHASLRADAIVISFTAGKTVFAGEGGAVLTDDRGLYERLLFFTQHPLRQRRELGIGIDNEFGFNARIHPLAAVWALSAFDRALRDLASHRTRMARLIGAVNTLSVFRPISIPNGDHPSFFRLTAGTRRSEDRSALDDRVRRLNPRIAVTPLPIRLLYAQDAFRAQYGRRWNQSDRCPVAEEQWRTRVCIALRQYSERRRKKLV